MKKKQEKQDRIKNKKETKNWKGKWERIKKKINTEMKNKKLKQG